MPEDSQEYLARKKFFAKLLTVYGRKPALEAVTTPEAKIYRVHLAESNKPAEILDDIVHHAQLKGAEILYHSRQELSRISKNSKQDQGVAVDVELKGFQLFDDFIESEKGKPLTLIALDNVTNPQNLGMIIRSVCASSIDGLLLPQKGCAKLDALVIKASAGTLFKTPIIRCASLAPSLVELRSRGFSIVGLTAKGGTLLQNFAANDSVVYVLGNESEGLSAQVQAACDTAVRIPMANGVESLNVAVTASLIAFRKQLA